MDDADYAWLTEWKWCALSDGRSFRAARAQPGTGALILMHREILQAPAEMLVDHINHDPLDNTRANLRLATSAQNNQNSRMRSDNVSGVRGVSWCARTKKWQACISVNGKTRFLGRFSEISDAAEARDLASVEFHGEFAVLNSGGD